MNEFCEMSDNEFKNHILNKVQSNINMQKKVKAAELIDKSKSNVLTKILEHGYKDKLFNDGLPDDGSLDKELQELVETQLDLYCVKSNIVFLTINPRPGVTFNELNTLVQKFHKKKFVKEYFGVYEIRKGPDEGLHYHIVFRYDCRPFDMTKAVKKQFMSVVGDMNNYHQVNIKYLKSELINDKINYMLGNKTKKKQSGVNDTKFWREKNNIPHYHESNPPLPCRVTKLPLIE